MAILYFLIWIILNGRITLEIMIFGILISLAVSLFSRKVMGYDASNNDRILRNLPLLTKYVAVLILEIIKAAFNVMKAAVSPGLKPDPVIVTFHSGLPSKFQNVLLANSITLTPGTFTLELEGDRFVIHCLRSEYAEGMEDSVFVHLLEKLK